MDKETLNRLKTLDVDISVIQSEQTQSDVAFLQDGVEQFYHENESLKEENQNLKDEINRLKGEQGKPKIRPQSKDKNGDTDHSSESERRDKEPKAKKPKKKKDNLEVHEQKVCTIDLSLLPPDAISKGPDSVLIQDIKFQMHNIQFDREVYYSPSLGKRFIAPLPEGYQGEYGPGLKAFILALHSEAKVTQPDLLNLLEDIGAHISAATISRILLSESEQFHEEKQEIVRSGKKSTDYQQIDDTGARVNGKNHYTHVLCNEFYTAYFTRPNKDRLTVLEILNGEPLKYLLSEEAVALMKALALPKKYWKDIEGFSQSYQQGYVTQEELDTLLKRLFPNPDKHHKNRQIILESSAVTAYQYPADAIKILLCDDAPQFKSLTELLALCWIHEGRHLKKLKPFRIANRKILDEFLDEFWSFYHALLDYKKSPSDEQAVILEKEFDTLFNQATGYTDLDDRISKIGAKQDNLRLVLKHPHIPLHNNTSELGARRQARHRDISLQTKNDRGTEAKDTMMTITQTAKKLKVSAYEYIKDRVSRTYSMPSLASIIQELASSDHLHPKPG